MERYQKKIASSPGVRTVALANRIPFGLWGLEKIPVHLQGAELESNHELPEVDFGAVTKEYFDALDIPILQGRNFTPRDIETSPRVVIVNETMAQRFWGSTNVVGQTVFLGPIEESAPAEVVGVARDTKLKSYREQPRPYLYMPFSQQYSPQVVVIAGTVGDPAGWIR